MWYFSNKNFLKMCEYISNLWKKMFSREQTCLNERETFFFNTQSEKVTVFYCDFLIRNMHFVYKKTSP